MNNNEPDANDILNKMPTGEIQMIEISDQVKFEVLAVPSGWLWTRLHSGTSNHNPTSTTTTFVPKPFRGPIAL